MKLRITIEVDVPHISHYGREELNAKALRSAQDTWGENLKYVTTEEIRAHGQNKLYPA